MSEQQSEQSNPETASHDAGSGVPKSSDALIDGTVASEAQTPRAGMPKAEPFMVEGIKGDVSRPAMPKGEAPSPEAPRTDAVKAGSTHRPRELLVMSSGERAWTRSEDHFESGSPAPTPNKPAGGRRFAAMAAMLLLAVIGGAAGGAFAIITLPHLTETAATAAPDSAALDASVGRIDADIVALKAGLERTTNADLAQLGKTSDRLDRIEKAQAESAAKLAKLGDAVDKIRIAAAVAPTPAATSATKDVTGTVTAPAGAQVLPMPQIHTAPAVTTAAPTTVVGRLPTIDGWVLRDVDHGSAMIEGRRGLYEVIAGDPLPGLGRVQAIRKQDGRWVVVTEKGLIVAR